MSRVLDYRIEASDTGQKLQVFLKNQLGESYSVRKVKGLIDRNQCRVNGRFERYGCTLLRKGDRVQLVISGKNDKIKVVYEDDAICVIDKPAGLLTEDIEGTPAHRLDRDTSGLLILAKGTKPQIVELFRSYQVRKRYLAIVDGIPEAEEGTCTTSIGGRTAKTFWQLEKSGTDCSLLRCYPETGRTHQIRIHLSQIGHPILGDGQYCRRFKCPYPTTRHLLHAERLIFPHPITGKRLILTARPPKTFFESLR